MKTIAFFLHRISERGTETAVYDYAHYNEIILGNKSYIICFRDLYNFGLSMERVESQNPFQKFNKRFTVLAIDRIEDMKQIIEQYSIDIFYNLVNEPFTGFKFDNKEIWSKCRTVKQCVFDTRFPEGDVHLAVSNQQNETNKTNLKILPHMINNHPTNDNLRKEFGIPESAIVFGRYGGCDTFNIQCAIDAIIEVAKNNPTKYFLFMNTIPFCELPNVIFLGLSVDMEYKRKFINTCNAFIHAGSAGENFGLAIGEFAICLKPIITSSVCTYKAHIQILKEKAILYSSKEELVNILTYFSPSTFDMTNNGYFQYTPESVMKIFDSLICSF